MEQSRSSGWTLVAGALASAVALFCAYHPLNWSQLAWFALVPITFALHYCTSLRRAVWGSFLGGAAFWLGSIFYVSNVTWPGYVLLASYLGIYWIPFGAFAYWWFSKRSVLIRKQNLAFMVLASMIWVGSEYLRCHLFTGFPMNNLAVSQFENIGIIQIADLGGEFLVSFIVVMMNLGIAVTILRYVVLAGSEKAWPHPEVMLPFTLIALSFWYSVGCYTRIPDDAGRKTVITAIQPNIPQFAKWDEEFIDHIYETMYRLTDLASTQTNVHLVVWPESAIPNYLPERRAHTFMQEMVDLDIPLLSGVMDFRSVEGEFEPSYFNSAIFFDGSLEPKGRYDKQHLVLMGEYVPLQRFFPNWLRSFSPLPASFSSGSESTVFTLANGTPFSSLICFEDMIPELGRSSVQNGARLLINQTNDGWFDPYWASRQRVAQCTFRCIENRVPAVRAGNTGVTCSIDTYGRVSYALDPFTSGLATMVVQVPVDEYQPTFYTRWGDWFGFPLAFVAVGSLLFVIRANRTKKDVLR